MTDPRRSALPRGVSPLRLAVIGALLAVMVVTVARSVAPARAGLLRTRAMVGAQEAENDALRTRIADRTAEADALRTDPWLVRRILRDEYRITDEGEVHVR